MGEKTDGLIYCPHCGASYYRIDYDSRTCVYFFTNNQGWGEHQYR